MDNMLRRQLEAQIAGDDRELTGLLRNAARRLSQAAWDAENAGSSEDYAQIAGDLTSIVGSLGMALRFAGSAHGKANVFETVLADEEG